MTDKTHPLAGKWRITSMDEYGEGEDIDLCGPAYIDIGNDGRGNFCFLVVNGEMEISYAERGIDFTWEGDSEGDPMEGSGFIDVNEDGSMECLVEFDNGDESYFHIRRWTAQDEKEAKPSPEDADC
jgi:hypothetical protein